MQHKKKQQRQWQWHRRSGGGTVAMGYGQWARGNGPTPLLFGEPGGALGVLPTTYYATTLLPTTFYLLPSTYYLLPTILCRLPTTYYLRPTKCYLLPTAAKTTATILFLRAILRLP